jgi:phosphate transport system protein
MALTFHAELDALNRRLLELSAMAEDAFRRAVRAFEEGDRKAAEAVIEGDRQVDLAEVDLEEECLKVMALHQPVASDLRFLITVLKLTGDLERVGDVAVKIARRTLETAGLGPPPVALNLDVMADRSAAMLSQSLDALIAVDAEKARAVRRGDDEVDAMKRVRMKGIKEAIARSPEQIDQLLPYMSVVRHLERVADYATSIAEEVVYLAEGLIVRHQRATGGGSQAEPGASR